MDWSKLDWFWPNQDGPKGLLPRPPPQKCQFGPRGEPSRMSRTTPGKYKIVCVFLRRRRPASLLTKKHELYCAGPDVVLDIREGQPHGPPHFCQRPTPAETDIVFVLDIREGQPTDISVGHFFFGRGVETLQITNLPLPHVGWRLWISRHLFALPGQTRKSSIQPPSVKDGSENAG